MSGAIVMLCLSGPAMNGAVGMWAYYNIIHRHICTFGAMNTGCVLIIDYKQFIVRNSTCDRLDKTIIMSSLASSKILS